MRMIPLFVTLCLLVGPLAAAPALRPSKPGYNVGETVQLLLEEAGRQTAVIRLAGGNQITSAAIESGRWSDAWKIPSGATLGLYEAEAGATKTSFVVYRQDLAIEGIRTERNLYTVGDTVRINVRMKNTGAASLRDLKVVIGRGYPWISGFGRGSAISGDPSAQIYTYPKPVTILPGQTLETGWFETMRAALAKADRPDIFNLFCWVSDKTGKDLYDLELTGTFVIQPMGYRGPLPYHPLYALYKFLDETDYRGVSYRELAGYSDELSEKTQLRSWMAFAPHYDDELSFFPLVPPSQKGNVPFHIVQLTAGDGNVDSIHRYVDGVSNPIDWHTLGRLRYWETVHAARIFNLQDGRDYSHLGLPDGGLLPIFEDRSGQDFFMFTTGTDRTPYDFVVRKNLPYQREAILRQLIDMIRQRRPEDIYTPHPDEGHGDHRTTTWFVLEALRRLRAENGYQPRVHVFVAYGAGDFPKAAYQYEPEAPLPMSDRTRLKLHFAEWAYQSQFAIAERGGLRRSLEELRKQPGWRWFLLKGW